MVDTNDDPKTSEMEDIDKRRWLFMNILKVMMRLGIIEDKKFYIVVRRISRMYRDKYDAEKKRRIWLL